MNICRKNIEFHKNLIELLLFKQMSNYLLIYKLIIPVPL